MNKESQKRFLRTAFLGAFLLTQSGCMVLVSGGAGLVPGIIAAALIGGGPVGTNAITGKQVFSETAVGVTMAMGAVLLDQKNPGRSDGLNVLPITDEVSKKYDVTSDDILTYNDELPKVIAVHQNIQNILKSVSENKASPESLTQAATSLGLKDGDDLKETLHGDKLSNEKLTAFASTQGLSETSAKIYLKSIGVKF